MNDTLLSHNISTSANRNTWTHVRDTERKKDRKKERPIERGGGRKEEEEVMGENWDSKTHPVHPSLPPRGLALASALMLNASATATFTRRHANPMQARSGTV